MNHTECRRSAARRGALGLRIAVLALVAMVGTVQGSAAFFGKDDEKPKAETVKPVEVPRTASGFPTSFADIYESRRDTVVNLRTTKLVQHPRMRIPGDLWDFFGGGPGGPGGPGGQGRPFSPPDEEGFKQRSLGSGVVIDADGFIITNNHVIEGADEILVAFANGDELEAELVGADPKTDLALIKVESKEPLPFVNLGDSDGVRVGDWVVAIGNPFGYTHTLTSGIVSAKERVIGAGPYDDFIQTDASINPGNSGGPLFDLSGEVIGINTAIATRSGGSQGVGFAVPSNLAKEIVSQLRENGRVTRGWMGVMIQDVSKDIAKSLKLDDPKGALVADLAPDGPAKKAGLVVGDIVIEFDGKTIESIRELTRLVAATTPGTKAEVVVLRPKKRGRGAERVELELEVGTFPSDEALARGSSGESDLLGLEVQALDEELAQQLGTEDTDGVVITKVESGGPAADAGLRRGDIIREINQQPVASLEEFREAIGGMEPDEPSLVLIERAGSTMFFTIRKSE